ncbi:MAG: hypothetical protein IID45_12620 [Planctomycetes bacterium]|nr:hypothetical protein [Planctomycetota bacterium]
MIGTIPEERRSEIASHLAGNRGIDISPLLRKNGKPADNQAGGNTADKPGGDVPQRTKARRSRQPRYPNGIPRPIV